MAIKNKFIHFKTRAAFDNYLVDHADDLYNYTTFIKETSEIYTHGNFYKSSNTWDISKLTSDASYAEVAFKTGKLGDAITLSDDVFTILMSININSWSLQFGEAIQELLYYPETKLFSEGITKILAEVSSIPLGAKSLPLSNGSAAIGNSDRYAKEDHIHPSDQSKQDKLVSGESIKTINNRSLLGEGNIITPDSKVTSAANHYTPKAVGPITAETIVNCIIKDEKGHVVNVMTSNGIDASKITSGTISIERLPKGALERLVIVANRTARFALTTADVQEGDTVKQNDTGVVYFVVNSKKLNNEAGYSVYTVGAATSVPWSGVTNAPTKVSQFTNDAGYLTSVPAQTWKSITGKPSVYPPSQHNHPSSNINTLTGYSKPTTTSAIVTSDSLNAALGKLEFALDNKVNTSRLNNYLPLSGGTVTGTLKLRSSFDSKLILDNTDGDNKYQFIEFMQQGTSYGKLGTMGNDELKWNNDYLATQSWVNSNNIAHNNEWNIVHKECKTAGVILINCRSSDTSSAVDTPVTKFIFLSGTGKTDSANHVSVQAKSFITVGGTASQMVLGDGTLAPIPTTYTLPTATSSVLGGIKVGSNITLSSGTISLSKANVTSALGYTPVNTSDLPEIPTALPNPRALTINDATYTGSSAISITVLEPLRMGTFIGPESLTVVEAGYRYSSTSSRTIASLDGFSESNPDSIIISTKKMRFTASEAIKMKGLDNLTGTRYIYYLNYMEDGKVAVNGVVYA